MYGTFSTFLGICVILGMVLFAVLETIKRVTAWLFYEYYSLLGIVLAITTFIVAAIEHQLTLEVAMGVAGCGLLFAIFTWYANQEANC